MFEHVPTDPSLMEGEQWVLRFWRATQAFEKLRAKVSGKPRWSFLDGPITANNPMGVHHAWGRTYKDAFQRFFAMTGHDQRFQNGFDCQGLWVEVMAERELGFKSKKDIEDYGVERFVNFCRDRVLHYANVITEQSIRLGMWMDWEDSYYTMSDENNYTIWSFLRKCHERGFIYKGLDSMPWCPRCGTGISEQERKEGYKLIEDDSVYVRFPLRDRDNEFLLVWTTTPWTLSANVAAAVSSDLIYLKVRKGEAIYYLAQERAAHLLETNGSTQVLEELRGEEMVGWEYSGPFDDLPGAAAAGPAHRIIPWDQVSATEGTGIVHIAPGCGKEDFELGKEHGLPVIAPIDEAGVYEQGFGFLTGKYAGDVAQDVYDDLKRKGLFYKAEKYLHDYPHCWRCETPLLFRAVDEWYIDMSWRDEIRSLVPQIRWIPDHGEAQELDWLNNMADWMISKKRYWGLALPIWDCSECGHFEVIGDKDELRERAVEGWEAFEGHSPHRPWVDAVKITCKNCGAKASRVPEVGNPWLDAGIIPYSTAYYSTDREEWAKWIPADFVVESFPGQFRNWFYALLAMSAMMEGIPPFKTLFGYGLVRDKYGDEMSKSKGNSIEFMEAAEQVSVDALRWMYCRQPPANNIHFDFSHVKQIERKVFGTLWNTYAFLVNYARLDEFDPAAPKIPVAERPEIDRWILTNLELLVVSAHRQFGDYWIFPFVRQAEKFIEELSNWYVRRNRRRFWRGRGEDDRDKVAAYQTMYEVLTTLLKLLAPVIPFLTERIYQNLKSEGEPESIHLCDFPEVDESVIDPTLSSEMRIVQAVVTEGHSLRESAQLRVRQPLTELRVAGTDPAQRIALERNALHVTDELNVKRLSLVDSIDEITSARVKPNFGVLGPRYGKDVTKLGPALAEAAPDLTDRLRSGETVTLTVDGTEFVLSPGEVVLELTTEEGWMAGETAGLKLALDVRVSPQLRREGQARDVVRHIQQLRRDSGLNIEDRIEVVYETEDEELKRAISEWESYIRTETLADSLWAGRIEGKGTRVTLAGAELSIWLRGRP